MLHSNKQWWLQYRQNGRTYLELGDRGLPPAGTIHGMYKDQLDTFLVVLNLLGFREDGPLWGADRGRKFEWRQIDHLDTNPVGWYEVHWKSYDHLTHNSSFHWDWEQVFREDEVNWTLHQGAIHGMQYGI
jgi:hypothetical protein